MKKKFNWIVFFTTSFIIIVLGGVFVLVHNTELLKNKDEILEVIITINGISSAILTTFLFGRLNISKDLQKEAKNKAIILCEKITDLRRILNEITTYFGVWSNDRSTKYLLDVNEFAYIDYFDYVLMSISDYQPPDEELIDRFMQHNDFLQADSELYLSMVSIVYDRKSRIAFNPILYDDYFDGEFIYKTETIEKMIEIGHLSRLSDNLKRYRHLINYNVLPRDVKSRINKLILRIDSNYDLKSNYYLDVLSKACYDIEADTLPKLLKALYVVEAGLSKMELRIIAIIKYSLVLGVLLPLVNLSLRYNDYFRDIISELLILTNFFIVLYFIRNIRNFSMEQLK